MMLKMIFLGSGSAFSLEANNYQSNVLLQKDNENLLIDAGGDIRFSLAAEQLSYNDIRNIYISHLHADHIGGLEWLAINTFFDPDYLGKPNLFACETIVQDLWDRSLSGGLRTISTELPLLNTFFNVNSIKQGGTFIWKDILFKLVQSVHVVSDYVVLPCYGLMICYENNRVYFTADSQYAPKQLLDFYEKATLIFHDCETMKRKSGVHAHYTELVKIPQHLKNKMWLYHYNDGKLPDAEADGFLGFVKRGQSFIF